MTKPNSPGIPLAKRKFSDIFPSLHDAYSPQKPKLRQTDSDALSEFVILAMRNNRNVPSEWRDEIEANRLAQVNLTSLQKWKMVEFVQSLVQLDNAQQLFATVLSAPIYELSEEEAELYSVIKLTMIDFSSMAAPKANPNFGHNHERSFWVEQAIPMFKYLDRLTGLAKFRW
jgi:hypothetical protein